jgi:hypothetical protein
MGRGISPLWYENDYAPTSEVVVYEDVKYHFHFLCGAWGWY